MPDNPAGNAPQFQTATYATQPAPDICKGCKQPISGMYYRANSAIVCGSCADEIKRRVPADNHSAFVRAILFGLVGFAIGLTVYAAFVIMTGISIGYLALAVGWIIGKAMMMGSGGIGGRRYQVTAVMLTYAAVSIAFIPIVISVMRSHKAEARLAQRAEPPKAAVGSASSSAEQQASALQGTPTAEKKPAVSVGKAIGSLV
ncbi:MAG TPA: hypothetical protein VE783_00355, partial [Candidatus Limnocylindrales bacterium]|nr:hypothetical protein [Candidatus Limnocylindrales bacterium]